MSFKTPAEKTSVFWLVSVVVAVLLAGLVGGLVYQMHKSEYQQQFNTLADSGVQRIVQNLSAADAMLDALVGLNQAGDEIDPYLFTPFSEKILQEYPFIHSAQYLSYILPQEKSGFIEEMHERGFSQFKIYTLDQSETPNSDSPSLVTSFIEPLTPRSSRLMGLDWIGSKAIEQEIELAVKNNSMVMINAPDFLSQTDQFIVLKPSYFGRSIAKTPQQRHEQLSGLFLLQLDWSQLVGRGLQGNSELDLKFTPEFKMEGNKSRPHLQNLISMDLMFLRKQTLQIGQSEIEISISSPSVYSRNDGIKLILWIVVTLAAYFIIVFNARSRYLDRCEKQRVQMQLFREREQAAVTLQSIADSVISVGINNEINYINEVGAKMLRKQASELIGQPVSDCVKIMDVSSGFIIPDPVDFFMELTQSLVTHAGKDIALNVEGSIISIDGNASSLLDSNGELIGYVLVLRDVSLERQLTNELVYQASHDALTGLVNRLEFENKLRDVLEISRQNHNEYSLCYLDMDQFKLVNDTCGHIAGDELLKQIAGILQVQMREKDLVARMGGDEFGVLIDNCHEQEAMEIAERIRQSLNDYHFSWEDKIFDVSASIGLVMINHLSGSLSEVLSCADLSCYAAKDAGRNTVHLYHAEDEEIAKKFSQMEWLPRIREALKSNEFELAVQRISALKSHANPLNICEFLLRWPQQDGSFISPALFIPSAERYDLMREMDRWILDQALSKIPDLEKLFETPGQQMYTINLSGQSIGDPGLADFIWAKIKAYGVAPELVCFEVTETVAIANFSVATDFINQLRERGCRFALDDFGSGLSSFGYLKRLPLDFLKIDGMFVRDMLKDPVDLAMVRTIHDVASVLKLKTIAEWVEEQAVLDELDKIGVDYAQGFFLDKPVLIKDLLA